MVLEKGRAELNRLPCNTDDLLDWVWPLQWMTERNNWLLWSVRRWKEAVEHINHRNSFYQAVSCHKCGLAKYRRKLKCLRSGTMGCWAQDWVIGLNRKWHLLCAVWCLQIKQEERRRERQQVLNFSVSINNQLSKSLQDADGISFLGIQLESPAANRVTQHS